MLAVRATCIVTISSSGIRNSLIFGSSLIFPAGLILCSSLILGPLLIIRTAPVCVLPRIHGRAGRASRALRPRRSCHWGGRWSSGAPGNK